jgi:hypothetical protein
MPGLPQLPDFLRWDRSGDAIVPPAAPQISETIEPPPPAPEVVAPTPAPPEVVAPTPTPEVTQPAPAPPEPAPARCADPICSAADLVRRTMRPASERLRLNQPNGIYKDGDSFIAWITATAPSHLYLDLIDVSGSVVHLRPNPLAPQTLVDPGATVQHGVPPGEERQGVRSYRIGPPFGNAMLLLLSSDQPLFAQQRPEIEEADAYLADLERAILQRQGAVRGLWRDLTIEPR